MRGEHVNHRVTVLDPAARGNLFAEHGLLAVVVHELVEVKIAAGARVADRPSGEASRHFLHVFLRVTSVNAERVQLHDLARVIFVQPARALRDLAVLVARPQIVDLHPPHAAIAEPAAASAESRYGRAFSRSARRSSSYPGRRASPGVPPWL